MHAPVAARPPLASCGCHSTRWDGGAAAWGQLLGCSSTLCMHGSTNCSCFVIQASCVRVFVVSAAHAVVCRYVCVCVDDF